MSLNQQVLGQRLKAARENSGLSQQIVCERLGVPRTAVTQMEGGRRAVSTLELAELARLYNYPIAHFFSDEPLVEDDLFLTLHRIEPNLEQDPVVKEQVQRCLSICREGAELERLLRNEEVASLPQYPVHAPRSTVEAIVQGTRIAEQERRRLGIGDGPIADMSDLIASQGIWVSGAILPKEMSGLFICAHSIGMAILVNYEHVRTRKRFSYAHEYAHALLDRERNATVSTRNNSSELIEKRANAFAASFLMPETGVKGFLRFLDKGQGSRQTKAVYNVAAEDPVEAELRPSPGSQTITYQDVAMLARYFQVSYVAAVYRLKSLDVISQKSCTHLLEMEDVARSYLELLHVHFDKEDPEDVQDRELRSQVIRVAMEAYRRAEISIGRLFDIGKVLNLPGNILKNLAEAA